MKVETMSSDYLLNDGLPLVPLLSRNGAPIAYEGQLILVQGQAKSGKSRLVQNFLHGWLVGDDNGLGLSYGDVGIAGLVTTEMSADDLRSRWRPFIAKFGKSIFDQKMRMLSISGKIMEGFKGNMHSAEAIGEWIQEKFVKLIVSYEIKVLVIDQIADLHITINSEEWWSIFMQELNIMAQKHGMLVIFILHENEGDYSKKGRARGHVGSIAVQKVTSIISVHAQAHGIFLIDFNRVRNSEPFKIRAEFDNVLQILKGLPTTVLELESKPGRKKKEIDYSVIGENKTRQEVLEILGKLMDTDKTSTIGNRISKLLTSGTIVKSKEGLYSYVEINYLNS